jgi:transglutaminase-like putative cysteine protease
VKEDAGQVTVLKVENLPSGAVIKLAVMDRFDGVVWNVASGETSGRFGRMPAKKPSENTRLVSVEDHDLATVWLYTVGQPAAVRFTGPDSQVLYDALRYNPTTGMLALPSKATGAISYTLDTVVSPVRPPEAVIAQTESGTVVLPPGVQVQAAQMKAVQAVGAASTAGAKALALEKHFQTNGYFSHGQKGVGEGAARSDSLAGHGAARITQLLEADLMVGDAEQYASAMALMGRAVGLPTRVVMGFAPGYGKQAPGHPVTPGKGSKGGAMVLTGADMTAWVEVNLEGWGWVPFFPTPHPQDSPQEAQQDSAPQPEPQVIQPPLPEVKPTLPPEQEKVPVPIGSTKPLPEASPPARWGWAVVAGGVFVLLVVALVGAVLGAKMRRRQRRCHGPPAGRMVAGWEELVDQGLDWGWSGWRVGATRRELAAGAPEPVAEWWQRLARESDAAAFGLKEPSEARAQWYWQGVVACEQQLLAGLKWGKRLRYRWSCVSLRHRRQERRGR